MRCEVGRARADPVFHTRYLAPQNFSEETEKNDPMDWSDLHKSVEFLEICRVNIGIIT